MSWDQLQIFNGMIVCCLTNILILFALRQRDFGGFQRAAVESYTQMDKHCIISSFEVCVLRQRGYCLAKGKYRTRMSKRMRMSKTSRYIAVHLHVQLC
jgi:hypothetical protein